MYRNYNRHYNTYNYGRRRYNPYAWRDEFYYDLMREFYYGGRRRRSRRATVEEAAEPPKEELAKVLNVTSIDMHIQSNTLHHKTDQYECTEDRTTEDGKKLPAKLVLRRGDYFSLTLTFDRPYDNDKHDLRLSFSYGKDPTVTRGTLVAFKLDETGEKSFKSDEWGAFIESKSGNSMKIKVHIPHNCLVGDWDFAVKSLSHGKDKDGKDEVVSFVYDEDTEVVIIFNAWCKDDPCYMATDKLLLEYVLNESGVVFQGNGWSVSGKAWDFGQFEDGVLEAALHVMKSAYRNPDNSANSDPVRAVRAIAMMVNSSKGGVLVGNWSGKYDGGTKPWLWKGSPPILKEFMKTKEAVKFGQCWVFSAVTTTVCRALGIPCRSVTNFQSAHDTEESNTIDKFFDKDGKDVTDNFTGDSVWNFHVWNEVWLSRSDLADTPGMDGWQVIDATPQEASSAHEDFFSEEYTCGPCPVVAVKKGMCATNFDCGFVFSEVNADVIHWQVEGDGRLSVLKIQEKHVGENISTKKPDGKSYPPEDYNPARDRYRDLAREARLDVTHEYKYPEGSEEERAAVVNAYRTARHPRSGAYDQPKYQKDVQVKLIHSNDVMIGSDLPITLDAQNLSKEDKEMTLTLRIYPKTYTGYLGKMFYSKEFKNIKLKVGEEKHTISTTLTQAEYQPHLVEMASMLIEVYYVVKKTATAEEQRTVKSHDFTFKLPGMKIEGPKMIKWGQTVDFKVKFSNPLNVPLTECRLIGESTAFKEANTETVPDIPANGEMTRTVSFHVKDKLKKNHHSILFTLDSRELQDIEDGLTATISQ